MYKRQLVIWQMFEPGQEPVLSHAMLHSACDYTPYEGRPLRCWPAHTLSRGRTVWRDGKFTAQPGDGQFQPCLRPREPRAGSPLAKWL